MLISELIAENEYAEMRGVSQRTIQRERATRTGPAFIKIGKKIFYRPAAIEEWLMAKEQAQPRAQSAA